MKRILLTSLLLLALGPMVMPGVTGAQSASNIYIVAFHEDYDPEEAALGLQQRYGVALGGIFRHALKGAVIHASAQQAAEIEKDARVRLVEPNQVYTIAAQEIPTGIWRVYANQNTNLDIDGDDDFRVDADVAVLDTGIDLDHDDLNLVMSIDCTWSGPKEGTCAGVRDDGNGHGTHVAGTIAALDNSIGVVGVAPGARLWAVKVLTNYGSGTTAQIVAGIDWVAAHAGEIEVANMSLGGPGDSAAMDLAISKAVAAGVTFVLSAGNRSIDVENYHPAGNPDAITVSALADFDGLSGGLGTPTCRDDIDDTLADFSNYGAGVNIIAPGVCIYSTYMDNRYATMSGTSMAAPHVSGAAAILASQGVDTPADIKQALTSAGNSGWIDDSGDGEQEPLLDLSSMTTFVPDMVLSESPIHLTAEGYTLSGWQYTKLDWEYTDPMLPTHVYRDGARVSPDEGVAPGTYTYTDDIGERGAGMRFYWVCQTSNLGTTCSDVQAVTY